MVNDLWPTVCKFSSFRATSIVAILQVPDGKDILATANCRQMHAKSMHGVQCYNSRLGSLLITPSLSTIGIALIVM